MPYSGSSRIISTGSVSAESIQSWFISRGPQGAVYVDLPYQPPPAELGQVIVDECRRYPDKIVNHDLCAAQIAHETAYWQSGYARQRNNPGGIGAINSNPDAALWFDTVADGVRAHVAHLLIYAAGDGPWSADDPRRMAVVRAGWLGTAPRLDDLNGKWAWPGATYGEQIATKANALVTHADKDVPVPPIDISGFLPPRIEQQWFAPNGKSYLGEPMVMHGVCIHQTGNTSPTAEAQQNVNYMKSAACIAREASWHATVGLEVVIETIPDDRQAFHASDGDGPGNTHFFAIEGVMCYKTGTAMFRRVMQNHAWYAAKKLRDNGFVPRWTGTAAGTIAQHNTFARDQKNCPQMYRDAGLWSEFLRYVEAFYVEAGQMPPPAPTDPNVLYVPETGFYIINIPEAKMLDAWYAKGSLAECGWPLGGMVREEDGVYRQLFENVMLGCYPDATFRFEGLGQRYAALLEKQP